MTLREFTSERERCLALAERAGTTTRYLWNVSRGYSRPSVELAKRIEAATRELGPEVVSAVELVFAEPVVVRRRYVRRAAKAKGQVNQDAANAAQKEI